ncbi:MAG: hypothetical protein ACD_2C00220G0001 [uncultured bacterium (gcode 4)]|uniref:Uncharacterized protein n=1 Tax=uncultured bacterium (gcode 4) TaxID=1234023 RepID=K2G1U3_9BACT|nr:MAG: hypothetical protein ACD_2C00220G0001 [uncultured bacterium (gcode 4)]
MSCLGVFPSDEYRSHFQDSLLIFMARKTHAICQTFFDILMFQFFTMNAQLESDQSYSISLSISRSQFSMTIVLTHFSFSWVQAEVIFIFQFFRTLTLLLSHIFTVFKSKSAAEIICASYEGTEELNLIFSILFVSSEFFSCSLALISLSETLFVRLDRLFLAFNHVEFELVATKLPFDRLFMNQLTV